MIKAIVWKVNYSPLVVWFSWLKKKVEWHFLFVQLTELTHCLHNIAETINQIDAINHIGVRYETMDSLFTVTLGMEWSSAH